MSDWFRDLQATRLAAWNGLVAAASDRTHPQHVVTIATVGRRGGAEARQVILRRADDSQAMVEIYTDTASDKVGELTRVPWATVLAWDPSAQLQVRLRAHVTVLSGDAARATWKSVPEGARANYGAVPPPGARIPTSDAYDRTSDPGSFAVLRCIVQEIETLHIGDDMQRRAVFRRGDLWRGEWLVP